MSMITDTLMAELKECVGISGRFKREIDNAKTNCKRQYYQKKITTNNKKVARLLSALNRIEVANASDD